MNTYRLLATLLCVALIVGKAHAHEENGPAASYPLVDTPAELPASPPLELLAHLPLGKPCGDLWAHKNIVYVGSWAGAKEGVTLIDLADPAKPERIGSLPQRPESSQEDMAVISADTAAFKGDLLAVGLQGKTAGVEFWDVTDPRQPQRLGMLRITDAPGAHELCLFQRGDRVFALLATIYGGLWIVDATDPVKPRRLSKWDLQTRLKINPMLGAELPVSVAHSVSTNADGTIAYLSYWDAGAVILDITDPARPRYLGRTVLPATDEGNTHSAVEADGGSLLITTDEDFDPMPAGNTVRLTAPASLAGLHTGIELAFTRQLVDTGPIQGAVVAIGSALPNVALRADPRGKIALVDPGTNEKQRSAQVLRAQEAGAIAVLFSQPMQRHGRPGESITIPGVSLFPELAQSIKKALSAGENVEAQIEAAPAVWGGVRFWDIRDRANPVQIGTFATPATTQYPPRRGAYTAHNPVIHNGRLYLSWYADGLRVVDFADPAHPREIGHFLPPFIPGTSLADRVPDWMKPLFGECAAVWGVVVHQGLILLSDLQSGLWILRDLPH